MLGNELAIRVTFDPSVLTPYTPGTVEKTAITRDMTISTILGSNTVSILANTPVDDHVTLKILGCAYESGPNHPIPSRPATA